VAQQLLDRGETQGRPFHQLPGDFPGFGHALALGTTWLARPQCLASRRPSSVREQEFHRDVIGDSAPQASRCRHRRARHIDLRQGELRVFLHDDDVVPSTIFEPPPHAMPLTAAMMGL